MTSLADIEARKLRHAARRELLDVILGDDDDPEQIRKRAWLLAIIFQCDSVRGKSQSAIAHALQITPAAVSKRVNALRPVLQ